MNKLIIIGDKIFKTQSECEKYTRSILTELGLTDSIKLKNEEYFIFLILLCKRHPYHLDKLKNMVDLMINKSALNKKGLELNIINLDKTTTEISWHICIKGICKTSKSLFNSALRQRISYQIKEFKDASDLSYCRKCNCSLINKTIHIDHHEIQFVKLVEDFLEINKKTIIIPSDYDKKQITFERIFKEEDSWIGKLFEQYHLQYATLRVLCESCNLTREKCKY